MCSIAGFFDPGHLLTIGNCQQVLREMTAAVAHRGPNDEGYFGDEDTGLYPGHRRLFIIDLSDAGHQPMLSSSGRYVIAYNSEIYNFRFMLKDLNRLNVRFRGYSDTEVLINVIEV